MALEIDASRLENFRRSLEASCRKRLEYKAVWEAFGATFPGRPSGTDERQWLKAALEQLVCSGVIRLPAKGGKNWDRHLGVELPLFIELTRSKVTARRQWTSFPWHPRLSWVADMSRLRPGQEAFLIRVHEGFVAGAFGHSVPLKYRSLQLTGDEKRLGILAKSELFGPGRLSLVDLGCVEDVPPLACDEINGEPSIIIFENAGSFAVARKVLSRLNRCPYGWIGFGGGRSIVSSIRSLVDTPKRFKTIEYVGDLDREGLHIANAARSEAHRAGLGEVRAAKGIHAAMIASAARFGAPLGWIDRSGSRKDTNRLLSFLPAEVQSHANDVLGAGRRIPEEVLGPDEYLALWQ